MTLMTYDDLSHSSNLPGVRAEAPPGVMIELTFEKDSAEKVKVLAKVLGEAERTLDPFTVTIADSNAIEKLGKIFNDLRMLNFWSYSHLCHFFPVRDAKEHDSNHVFSIWSWSSPTTPETTRWKGRSSRRSWCREVLGVQADLSWPFLFHAFVILLMH